MSAILLRALEGESEFRQAVSNTKLRPAHAQFALGVLQLARGSHDEAAERLGTALPVFMRTPEVYRRDGTLALAQTYLGVAISLSLKDTATLRRACEELRSGLAGGTVIPRWLLTKTVESVALSPDNLLDGLVEAILGNGFEEDLTVLSRSAIAGKAPSIVAALLGRARSATRAEAERIADYRAALPHLLSRGDVAAADEALQFLETSAVHGIARDDFLEVLADERHYSPAWDDERVTEAQVRLLEAQGRFPEAAILLEQAAYRCLAMGEDYALDEADLIVAHLRVIRPRGD